MSKIYACSDLHGQYDLWQKIKNIIGTEHELYFLGDAADRGEDGYKIMKEILEMPNVHYFQGNHEDFFVTGCSQWLKTPGMLYGLWIYQNGGTPTFSDWCDDTKDNQSKIIQEIQNLPLTEALYLNEKTIYLSHAGFTPENTDLNQYDYLWNRSHFVHPWPKDRENTYVIHGHTPTPFLIETLKSCDLPYEIIHGAVKYANGHKIDIDLGCFASHKTCLLDLDTFEIVPIESDIYPIQDFWK